MSRCQSVARPLARRLQQSTTLPIRPFTSTAIRHNATVTSSTTPVGAGGAGAADVSPLDQDPYTVLPEFEAALLKSGKMPIGSRRRRVALRTVPNSLPFEQLPYQAFQEARSILAADREDKLQKIQLELGKIAAIEAKAPEDIKGGQEMKDAKLGSLRRYVERLKILADINDPVVKKRFEDGLGEFPCPPHGKCLLAEKLTQHKQAT